VVKLARTWRNLARTLKSGAYFGKDMIRSGGNLTPSAIMSGSIFGLNAIDSVASFGKPIFQAMKKTTKAATIVLSVPVSLVGYTAKNVLQKKRQRKHNADPAYKGSKKGKNLAGQVVNGRVNGKTNGKVNGRTNGKVTGKVNGRTNGKVNGNVVDPKAKKPVENNKNKQSKEQEMYQKFLNNPNAIYNPMTGTVDTNYDAPIQFTPEILDKPSKLKDKKSVLDPIYSKANQDRLSKFNEEASPEWLVALKNQLELYGDAYEKFDFDPDAESVKIYFKQTDETYLNYMDSIIVSKEGLFADYNFNYLTVGNSTEILTTLINDYSPELTETIFALYDYCIQNLGAKANIIK
jgi:hypothetical protein